MRASRYSISVCQRRPLRPVHRRLSAPAPRVRHHTCSSQRRAEHLKFLEFRPYLIICAQSALIPAVSAETRVPTFRVPPSSCHPPEAVHSILARLENQPAPQIPRVSFILDHLRGEVLSAAEFRSSFRKHIHAARTALASPRRALRTACCVLSNSVLRTFVFAWINPARGTAARLRLAAEQSATRAILDLLSPILYFPLSPRTLTIRTRRDLEKKSAHFPKSFQIPRAFPDFAQICRERVIPNERSRAFPIALWRAMPGRSERTLISTEPLRRRRKCVGHSLHNSTYQESTFFAFRGQYVMLSSSGA